MSSYNCSPSAAICLVNDLDLTVQASGLAGYTLYGNGEPDKLNNVERVRMPVALCRRPPLACSFCPCS